MKIHEDLVDIRDIKIDTELSKEERIQSYLKQIKNPYLYKCGDLIIHVKFNKDGETFEALVKESLL